VGRNPEQVVGDLCWSVGVEYDGKAAIARRQADRPHEVGKAIVGKHRVDRRHQAGGIVGQHRLEALIAIGHDDPIAARVDKDR
jgi:hypothetical protein